MANKRIYRLSPLAEQDLEDLWRYTLREWSADQADRYYHSIISAIEVLLARRSADTSSILKNTMTIST